MLPVVQLKTGINIVSENYMTGTYDGKVFNCVLVTMSEGGGEIVVNGVAPGGGSVLIRMKGGTTTGGYSFGDIDVNGNAFLSSNVTNFQELPYQL
jgi:hypothetical protein